MKPIQIDNMLRIRTILLYGLTIFFAACSGNASNFVLPPTATQTVTPLAITEAAPEVVEAEDAFATQEPLVVQSGDAARGVDSAEIAPLQLQTTPINEVDALEAAADVAMQQLVMSEMISLLQTNYVDETLNGVDWQAVLEDQQNSIDVQSDAQFWVSMAETLALLEDTDAYFMSPEEVQAYEQMIRGREGQVGIGVVTMPRPKRRDALIVWAIEDNAAFEAGVRSRDRLIAVDGEPVCCDARGNMLNLIAGSADSTVQLTIQSPDEAERLVNVTRQPLMLHNPVEAERIGDVGVITIHSFVVEEVDLMVLRAWEQLNATEDLNGLVIDVRSNTGGFEQEMTHTMALFTNGNVGAFRGRHGSAPLLVAGRDELGSQSIPLVILIGEATGSQAEIFAGVLQAQDRATLIGNHTQGKINSIFPHDLSDGSRVWLPEDRFELHNGHSWISQGLTPDVEIKQAWSEIADMDDDQVLAAALVLLRGR